MSLVKQPMRSRETIDDEGRSTTSLNVLCPIHQRATDLDTCDACERCRGMHVDPLGSESFVLCEVPPVRPAEDTPVSEVMTSNVACVTESVTLFQVEAILLQRGISGVPVVDEEGFPRGVVTKTDLVRARFEKLGEDATVKEVMMPIAFTLEENAPVELGAALMAAESVHRVPVVGASGRVVGILSSLDVLRWIARRAGYTR